MSNGKNSNTQPPTGSPPAAFDYTKGRTKWFEASGALVVDRNRYFFLLLIALICITVLTLFVFRAYHDNKSVPYILKEGDAGALKAVGRVAEEFTPTESNKRYFGLRWIALMRERETPKLTEQNLKLAWSMTRGKAQDEFRRLLDTEKPLYEIQKDQSISVRIDITSMTLIDDGVFLIRFRETRSSQFEAPRVSARQLTVRFIVDPPKSDEERDINPIGFYILSFDFKDEK